MSNSKPSRRALWYGTLATTLASILMVPSASRAADLGYADAPEPIPQQMVAFGSGWYVRGDIAATDVYNVGLGRISSTSYEFGVRRSRDIGYNLSLGGGYAFTNNIRSDVIVDFQQPTQTKLANQPCVQLPTNSCMFAGQFNRYDALVNVYYDFGTWTIVTPYIGAGAGVGFGNVSTKLLYDTKLYTGYSGYHNFAWALMAGAAFDVYSHIKLDVGYRFLNNGKVFGANVYNHQIRAGLRYMIDN